MKAGQNGKTFQFIFLFSVWPGWVENLSIISQWLLILNSSCNIAIYLHKDPKFKAVLRDMFVSKLSPRLRTALNLSETTLGDENQEGKSAPQHRMTQVSGFFLISYTLKRSFLDDIKNTAKIL